MKKTGELALELKLLQPHQLQEALMIQKESMTKDRLGEILLKLKFISDQQHQKLLYEINLQKRKREICFEWISRYTGQPAHLFGKHLVFTVYYDHLRVATEMYDVKYYNEKQNFAMPALKLTDDISLICVRSGSPQIAMALDMFSAIDPECIIFLGECGAIKRHLMVGDLILPSSAIRADETSHDYAKKSLPAMPAYNIQDCLARHIIQTDCDYSTGVVYTTNRRLWEFDMSLCQEILKQRILAVDMETATFFTVALANNISVGAVLLVSFLPLLDLNKQKKEKTDITRHVKDQLYIAVSAAKDIVQRPEHLKCDDYNRYTLNQNLGNQILEENIVVSKAETIFTQQAP